MAEEQQAQAEYELSDKSASLSEAQEQLAEVRRQLAEVRQSQAETAAAAAQHGGAAARAAAELEAARARAAELGAALSKAEGALEAHQTAVQDSAAALAAREAELGAQRSATGAAERRASELAAQLQQLQQVTLLEKEQQVRSQGWSWSSTEASCPQHRCAAMASFQGIRHSACLCFEIQVAFIVLNLDSNHDPAAAAGPC